MSIYTELAQGVRDYYIEQYLLESDETEQEHLMDMIVFWSMEALNKGKNCYLPKQTVT